MLKNKYLTTYLFGYLFIWIVLTTLFNNKYAIGANVVENMVWSHNLSIMYDKHPGLGAFVLKIFSFITFGNPILATLLASGTCMLIALIYTYKISRIYFSKEESTLIVIATTFSAFYILRYFTLYNQNIILLPFWVMASYYFLLIQNNNSYKNWILLSIVTALGVYAKFEILLLSGIMFLYIVFTFKKEYISKLIIAAIIFFLAIIPALIGIAKQNYTPILWIFSEARIAGHQGIMTKILIGQLYNLLLIVYTAAPLLIIFIFIKIKKISFTNYKFLSNLKHPLVAVCLYPLFFVFILQSCYGTLPDGWGLVILSLFLPGIYKLLNLKIIKTINFKKLISILLILQLTIFSSYTVVKYFNDAYVDENTGNSLAIEADSFWSKYDNSPIPYVSGYNADYLAAFSKSKPILLRDYNTAPKNTKVLISMPGCNGYEKNIEQSGFKILDQECVNISSINKYQNQTKEFSLFIIEKTGS